MANEKPKCIWCGKPLKIFSHLVSQPTDQPKPTECKGQKVLKVTYRYDFIGSKKTLYRVWIGDYGYRGDGTFCGLRCGYNYGLDSLRE